MSPRPSHGAFGAPWSALDAPTITALVAKGCREDPERPVLVRVRDERRRHEAVSRHGAEGEFPVIGKPFRRAELEQYLRVVAAAA